MLQHRQNDHQILAASDSSATPGFEDARAQVERILASDTFRSSEVLRRLLKFLSKKTFSGEAASLKEYSVGLDALGKPPTYDPRQDSAVRLQASRLRQKLDEYYRGEGKDDPLTIELPRGRFKIVWQPRFGDSLPFAGAPLTPILSSIPAPADPAVGPHIVRRWRSLAFGLAVISLVLAMVVIWLIARTSQAPARNSTVAKSTPELDALWRPFISSSHHLIVAFSDPLFVRFQREGSPDILYHQRNVAGWDDAVGSPEFSALSRSLGHPVAEPSFDYAPRGELIATFALSQFLAPRRSDVSVIRMGQLSWQQFADNDVIFLAPRSAVAEKQASLPVRLAFIADKSGIRNIQPLPGEPQNYLNPQPPPESSGETFELVSVMPGPLGRTTTASFTGGRAWGVMGAMQSLLDPAFARVVVQKLKGRSGEMPASYQIVIRIRYRDGTPTNASYVTHRVLGLTQNSAEAQR